MLRVAVILHQVAHRAACQRLFVANHARADQSAEAEKLVDLIGRLKGPQPARAIGPFVLIALAVEDRPRRDEAH